MRIRGYLLQATYRVQGGVPVVHLFGKTEAGETFLLRDTRQTPHFYIRSSALQRAHSRIPELHTRASDRTDFSGAPMARVDVAVPGDAPAVRDRLHAHDIDTFEADVRFAYRFLIDRGIRNGLEIRGEPTRGDRVHWIFDDATLAPAQVAAQPAVLSFDIETDPSAQRLLAIALYGPQCDEVLVVRNDQPIPEQAIAYADERTLLRGFVDRVQALDPDVLTGWNVVDFDLAVLQRRAERLRVPLSLGRIDGAVHIRAAQGYFGSGHATVPGRVVLDGMDLVRGAFIRMEAYSLDTVARSVLGEGKTIEGGDRADAILDRYQNDMASFCEYARTDARLAYQIVDELDLVPLAFARSRLTGMTPDRVAASIASFDFLYLSELGKRRIVAPTVRAPAAGARVAQAGGQVFEPEPGIYNDVWVFDFKSLYPSIIRTFNIDPLGFVDLQQPRTARDRERELIRLDGVVGFKRDAAILPGMLDELFPAREQAKRDGDAIASQAIKILMNSFYGVLGTPACRFYNAHIANAITGQGRHLLDWTRQWFESRGYRVLYGDTDSVFVLSGGQDPEATGRALAAELNRNVSSYVRSTWDVDSRLELEFEKLYQQLYLPSMRGTSAGARKRYAGVVDGRVEFVGMEVVRRDWTDLAKMVQRELFARLFGTESSDSVEDFLRRVVDDVRAGRMDEQLVYRKGLRKPLAEYTANTPPHVAAARKSRSAPDRIVAYVVTESGPEPLDNITAPLDREHYVQKQIRPVAEPVLSTMRLEFSRVIGDDRQLGLF